MADRRAKERLDLREVLERARTGTIEIEDIHTLSLSSRCALIRRMIDADNGVSNRTSATSLLRLSKTFEISEDFHEWQRQRRQSLIRATTKLENLSILDGFRNWHSISLDDKKSALKQSVRLHRDTYVQGLTEKLPFNHEFLEGGLSQKGKNLTLIFGSFSGDLKTGHCRIRQYQLYGELQRNPLEAFTTAHHEATHLIQHHLSVAFHKNQISPSHPLYQEAAYFHAIDTHKAYIPSAYAEAYAAQPNEVFAEGEGSKISSAIQALAC